MSFKKYQKIETLYEFDNQIKKFKRKFYNPVVQYLSQLEWYGTEKVDGTNIRVLWNGYTFEFGGRTDEAVLPKEVKELLENTFNKDMEILVEQQFQNKQVIFFMECYAGKIQRGAGYKGSEKLIGFDIMCEDIYLEKNISKEIFESIGIPFVPILKFASLYAAEDWVLNNDKSIIDPTTKIEGLVCYPKERIYNHKGDRIIVKIKKRDLLKLEDAGK